MCILVNRPIFRLNGYSNQFHINFVHPWFYSYKWPDIRATSLVENGLSLIILYEFKS